VSHRRQVEKRRALKTWDESDLRTIALCFQLGTISPLPHVHIPTNVAIPTGEFVLVKGPGTASAMIDHRY
jgi:hypothetical protein